MSLIINLIDKMYFEHITKMSNKLLDVINVTNKYLG